MPKELSINFTPTRRSVRLELKRIKKDTELDSSEEPLKSSVIPSAVSNRSAIVKHSNEPATRAQQSEQISGVNGSNNVETIPMDVDDATEPSLSAYMANEKVHYPSDTPYTLFVLADGHGGSHASRHFCRMVPEAVQEVLCSNPNFPNDSSPSQLKMYSSLQKARIYRPPDFQNPFGLTNDISLNLGDTMGDLFFKLDPPLFPCEADVDFLIMESGVDYIGVMAPDGLWDHMNVKMPEFIRKLARYLGLLTSCEDSDYMIGESTDDERDGHRHKSKKCNPIPSDPMQNMLNGEQLHDLSGALCDRTKDTLDIFEKDQGRYDDCTVIAFSCKY